MALSIDDYAIIMGSPIKVDDGIIVYQPTLDDIKDLPPEGRGHETYQQYLSLLLLKQKDIFGVLEVADDTADLAGVSVLQLVGAMPELRDRFIEALKFFIVGEILWDKRDGFRINGTVLTEERMDDIREVVCRASGIAQDKEDVPTKFASKKAKAIWEKMQKGRAEAAKHRAVNRDLLLPNLIGALCARHPSYNLLNVGKLTVAQLYDQFQRTNNNVTLDISSHRWAAWGQDKFPMDQWYKNLSTNK